MSEQISAGRLSGAWAAARSLEPSVEFWFAIFAASALGTNLGDFWADALSLGLASSFASLAAIGAVVILADRRWGRQTEVFFWIAIVVLRAAATNVGDFATDDLAIVRPVSICVFGVATLAAGCMTLGLGSPRIDARYWFAMFLGGVFGTVGGDFVSHAIGLPWATVGLAALLAAAVSVRSAVTTSWLLGYWIVVLIERTAGTPAADLLAEHRGLGYGLPAAMAMTGGALAVALLVRGRKVVLAAQ